MGQKLVDLFEDCDACQQPLLSPDLLAAVSQNKAHIVKQARSKKPKSGSCGSKGSLTLTFR